MVDGDALKKNWSAGWPCSTWPHKFDEWGGPIIGMEKLANGVEQYLERAPCAAPLLNQNYQGLSVS